MSTQTAHRFALENVLLLGSLLSQSSAFLEETIYIHQFSLPNRGVKDQVFTCTSKASVCPEKALLMQSRFYFFKWGFDTIWSRDSSFLHSDEGSLLKPSLALGNGVRKAIPVRREQQECLRMVHLLAKQGFCYY